MAGVSADGRSLMRGRACVPAFTALQLRHVRHHPPAEDHLRRNARRWRSRSWPDDVRLSDLEAGYSPETAIAQIRVQVRPVPLFRVAKLPPTFFAEGFRVRSNVDLTSIFETFSS